MRGWTLSGLVALGIASGGCSLEQRVTHLEHQSGKDGLGARVKNVEDTALVNSAVDVKWHRSTLERLAAIERREERTRLELARLERWETQLEAREAALAKAAATPAAPAPKPPEPVELGPPPRTADSSAPAPASKPGDSLYVTGADPWADPISLTMAQQVSRLYSTGERPKNSDWLDTTEKQVGTGQDVTLKPRDPGATGKDGQGLLGKPLTHTRFVASSGDPIDLARLKGKKNVVLVVLRGFDGSICIACSGQTLAISQNLDEFAKRDAEVYLLYPGKAESVPVFLDAVRDLAGGGSLPVEILLDVDLSVVHDFNIEGKLAKPTTLILDKEGIVRFAHVGQSKTDRPTVPQMLEALDRMASAGQK